MKTAILLYIPCAILTYAGKIATFVFAPFVCLLPLVYADENSITGYPSEFPGKPRAFLPTWCRWMQSFDDCLDAYWYSGKSDWLRKWFDQDYYDSHAWLRWYTNVLWLWRNPAYGLALKLGYDQTGLEYVRDDDPVDTRWESDESCSVWRVVTNAKGQTGWLWRKRTKHIELILGYRIPWNGVNNAMVAVRLKPNWR